MTWYLSIYIYAFFRNKQWALLVQYFVLYHFAVPISSCQIRILLFTLIICILCILIRESFIVITSDVTFVRITQIDMLLRIVRNYYLNTLKPWRLVLIKRLTKCSCFSIVFPLEIFLQGSFIRRLWEDTVRVSYPASISYNATWTESVRIWTHFAHT